jgi:hypothetical protein
MRSASFNTSEQLNEIEEVTTIHFNNEVISNHVLLALNNYLFKVKTLRHDGVYSINRN